MEQKYPILIVEDKTQYYYTLSEMLEELGFHTFLNHKSGENAIKTIKKANGLIHMIFMDNDIKGELPGSKTAQTIHKEYPQIPIIGYSDSFQYIENAGKISTYGMIGRIKKNTTINELEKSLKRWNLL